MKLDENVKIILFFIAVCILNALICLYEPCTLSFVFSFDSY